MNTWTEKAKTSFWSKVDQSGGPDACWPWTLSKSGSGYGQVNMGKSHGPCLRAHRVAYTLGVGPIYPPVPGKHGAVILHTCDNRLCCNPKHLRKGTQADNVRDAFSKGRNKAPQGHSAEIKRRAAAYPELVAALRGTVTQCADFENMTEECAAVFRQARALLAKLGESV